MHRVKRHKLSKVTGENRSRVKARPPRRALAPSAAEPRPAGEQAITEALYAQITAAIKMNEPGAH